MRMWIGRRRFAFGIGVLAAFYGVCNMGQVGCIGCTGHSASIAICMAFQLSLHIYILMWNMNIEV